MEKEQLAELLAYRIEQTARHHGGAIPERNAIGWRGYLAGLLEWDVISISAHDRLLKMLPDIPQDPVVEILLGYEDEDA